MAWKRISLSLAAACLLWPFRPAGSQEVQVGAPFPPMVFEDLVSADGYESLGLRSRSGPIELGDIEADLLVLEFFNTFCLTCWRQAPQLQSFSELLAPGDLAGKVRILSVGSGNRPKELLDFRREFKLSYAISPDPFFDRFNLLGNDAGAPYTALLVREGEGWVVADYHVGFVGDVELLAMARVLLKEWTPLRRSPDGAAGRRWEAAAYGEEARIFLGALRGDVAEVESMQMADGSLLFRGLGADGAPVGVFARVARRDPVCDLCHPILFLFAFDEGGRVLGFEPIFVTKFGNETWNADDTDMLRARLKGRKNYELAFDSDVDAVTSATMSSALIFDEIRRSGEYLKELNQ
jgi:hypothetical protein